MTMIEFVRDYSDLSTDRQYQFDFRCDHCGNGYKSSYEASIIGTAGGLLQAAGSIFGGFLGNAGNSTYEIQRAIGGPAHDRALQTAVAEVKQKFHRCLRCGEWVCAEICWNVAASQCTRCTPKYEQEVIALRTQAQILATQRQMQDKAAETDYVSGIDMHADAQVQLNPSRAAQGIPANAGGWTKTPDAIAGGAAHCATCGAALSGGKFCPECGAATAPVAKACAGCGHVSGLGAKFCEECGAKMA